ncbi:hypothetical protein FGG12_11550 [Cupriavidus campinensis]|uniref:Uncharacterized protein n=1 Tax=Cupriavidus campinensis TaxID=151783 RepID=A0ABY3EPD5_9BURK|nr:hypothetical protein FGG12_11550 [Cupriavidus campinensis]
MQHNLLRVSHCTNPSLFSSRCDGPLTMLVTHLTPFRREVHNAVCNDVSNPVTSDTSVGHAPTSLPQNAFTMKPHAAIRHRANERFMHDVMRNA